MKTRFKWIRNHRIFSYWSLSPINLELVIGSLLRIVFCINSYVDYDLVDVYYRFRFRVVFLSRFGFDFKRCEARGINKEDYCGDLDADYCD